MMTMKTANELPNKPAAGFISGGVSRCVLLAMVAGLTLTATGCYKSDFEAAKKEAEEAKALVEKTKKDSEAAVAAARQQAEQMVAQVRNQMSRGRVQYFVDGQDAGYDEVAFDQSRGVFVRNGSRVRGSTAVQFQMGRLADQNLSVVRDNGKPNFTGAIRNSRPDGEWMWFDSDGKPYKRETWADGKLQKVEDVTVARDGKQTFKAADRRAWATDTRGVFANFPELIRDTSAPAAAPKPPAGSGSAASGAAKTPGSGTTPRGTGR